MSQIGKRPGALSHDDLGRARNGARMAVILPLLREEIARNEAAGMNQIFQDISNGTFTPEKAVIAWMQVYAHRKLLMRLEALVKMGIDAGLTTSDGTLHKS